MSYLSILGLRPGEPYGTLLDLRNSWLGAPALWEWVGKRHVSPSFHLFEPGDMERVFALKDDPAVPLAHRRVLAMTFERAVVREADYAAAARDLRDMPAEAGSHWAVVGRFLADGGAGGWPMVGFLASQNETLFPDLVEGDDGQDVLEDFDWSTVYDVYAEVG